MRRSLGELLLTTVALGDFLALGRPSSCHGSFRLNFMSGMSTGVLGSLRVFLELHLCWVGMVESESREVEGDLCPKHLLSSSLPASLKAASLNSCASLSGQEEEPSSPHLDSAQGSQYRSSSAFDRSYNSITNNECKMVMLTKTIQAN